MPPIPAPLPVPIHELNAETTAAASSRGTRIQTVAVAGAARPVSKDEEDEPTSIFRISIGIADPVRPRNCVRAEVRYVRAEMGSRDTGTGVIVVVVVPG